MMLLQSRLANWNYLPVISKAYLHFDGFIEKKKSVVYSFSWFQKERNTDKGLLQIYREADQFSFRIPVVLAGTSENDYYVWFFFFFLNPHPTPPNTHST